MDRRRERRSVSIIQIVERFQRHARGDAGHRDIDHFIHHVAKTADLKAYAWSGLRSVLL